jgi:hypothetical protein
VPGNRLLPPHAEVRPVFIKLTESGSASFEGFTEETLGRVIRIVVGDRGFMAARIAAPITSGRLQGTFSSPDAAMAWSECWPANYQYLRAVQGRQKGPTSHGRGRNLEFERVAAALTRAA